jgi:hypothetical protein
VNSLDEEKCADAGLQDACGAADTVPHILNLDT